MQAFIVLFYTFVSTNQVFGQPCTDARYDCTGCSTLGFDRFFACNCHNFYDANAYGGTGGYTSQTSYSLGSFGCDRCARSDGYGGTNDCILCPPSCSSGQYILKRSDDCICDSCPSGRFCTNNQITGTCAAGTYSGVGQSVCTNCNAGTYGIATGSITSNDCLKCVAGKYSTTGSTVCLNCIAGTFSTGTGIPSSTICSSCNPGTFSTAIGANDPGVCITCNTTSACPGGSTIVNCLSGSTYCDGITAKNCTVCGAGKYQTVPCTITQDTFCSDCLSNSYCTGGTAITNCTSVCLPGTYQTVACTSSTNRVCTACEPTFYCLGNTAKTSCTLPCAANQYEMLPCTSTSNRVCAACPTDSTCNGITATCNVGTFNTLPNTTKEVSCRKCPAGSYLTGSGISSYTSCTRCAPGAYTLTDGATSASSCISC